MILRPQSSIDSRSAGDALKANAPTRLRVEHLEEALGIGVRQPRLSWWLPEGAREQVACQLRTSAWDSGRIETQEHLLVTYPGPPMQSRQRAECAVKVWTDRGESEWSDTVRWEMGLLDPNDWEARWIEPPEGDERPPSGKRPGWHLRRDPAVEVVGERLDGAVGGPA